MKTKNKMIAMLGIAIVLCSVFLVALPVMAIAAEQTTQEVSATASTITTASEDDYVLGIYGNANEDDTIDMRDLTYVKLIFFGKKPETELADAKYDGKINPLDFIQIKLIIVGKEKEITLVDSDKRIVTVKKPVERVITIHTTSTEAVRMLGAKDKIVGVCAITVNRGEYFPDISKLPSVGSVHGVGGLDIEAILNLKPDVVFQGSLGRAAELDEKLPDSIAVVGLSLHHPVDFDEDIMRYGYILDKKDEATHYIDDFHDKYIDLIKARTEGLSEEERQKFYLEWGNPYRTYAGNSYDQQKIDIAGGRNIFADIPGLGSINVDPEEVVMRNPDIIVQKQSAKKGGYYCIDDESAEAARDAIMSRPELANVDAVKNGRVYIIESRITIGPAYPTCIAYYAKWLYPELFEDLDPQAIHQEFIDEFCPGFDYNVYEYVFAYPPFED